MRFLHLMCVATALGVASAASRAADMTPEERSEVRERAERLQSERQRDPSWDGGTRRVNEPRADVRRDRNRGEASSKTNSTTPKSKGERVKRKVKRTVKELPGALVRRR